MSTALSHNLPESLLGIRTRPLFVLREAVPPLIVIGQTPNAFRRIGVIQGGSFEGERLSGEVVTGNDWQAVRTDSCIKLDVRLVLKTTDGELIVMTYTCLPPSASTGQKQTIAAGVRWAHGTKPVDELTDQGVHWDQTFGF
jgi:hypothetical protein